MHYIRKQELGKILANYTPQVVKLLGATNYCQKIICPFHEDKNASLRLYVNNQRLVGYCFGCGKFYPVEQIYAEQRNIDVDQAIEEILTKLDIDAVIMKDRKPYEQALNYIQKLLLTDRLSDKTLAFFKKKGLEPEFLKKYGISELKKCDIKAIIERVAQKTSLSVDFFKRTLYPVQPNRIIYPIRDCQNRLIGFASRTLKDGIKYLNSYTTPLYKKSNVLYGLWVLPKNQDTVFIVEGYNDALAMWKYGFYNTVAVGGTALTKQHAKKLLDLGYKKFILMFDPDRAGREAMVNAITDVMIPLCIDGQVAFLPRGKDIDEYLAEKQDPIAVLNLKQMDIFSYAMKAIKNPKFLLNCMQNAQLDYVERNVLKADFSDKLKYYLLYKVTKSVYVNLHNSLKELTNAGCT